MGDVLNHRELFHKPGSTDTMLIDQSASAAAMADVFDSKGAKIKVITNEVRDGIQYMVLWNKLRKKPDYKLPPVAYATILRIIRLLQKAEIAGFTCLQTEYKVDQEHRKAMDSFSKSAESASTELRKSGRFMKPQSILPQYPEGNEGKEKH